MLFNLKNYDMNLILKLSFVLFTSILFAQSNNVYVEYGAKIHDEKELFSVNKNLRLLLDQAINQSDNFLFGLIINKSASKFFDNSQISDAGVGFTSNGLNFAGYLGVIYNVDKYIYRETPSLGKEVLVKENFKENWELHNESKMIDNYLCYKATNAKTVVNGNGKTINHPVVAWYCPELPYRYGPLGYGNLPGLILELQVRNVVFGVKKLDLKSALDFDANFLKTVKTMPLDELNKKLQEDAENFRG
jgi:GLPGLI family protein